MNTAGAKASVKRFHEAMLRGAKYHILLDIFWAGESAHLSDSDVVVHSTAQNEDINYTGSLEARLDVEEALNLFSQGSDIISIPFSAVMPFNVPQLISRGHDLSTATGEMSIWIEGTTYEERRVVLVGKLNDPEYGYENEPINASLQNEFFNDKALIPPSTHVINEYTWSQIFYTTPVLSGLAYPFVFGQDDEYNTTHSPAYVIDTRFGKEAVLVAGHPIEATQVTLFVDATHVKACDVYKHEDNLHQVVTVADISTNIPGRWIGGTSPITDISTYSIPERLLRINAITTGTHQNITLSAASTTGDAIAADIQALITAYAAPYDSCRCVYIDDNTITGEKRFIIYTTDTSVDTFNAVSSTGIMGTVLKLDATAGAFTSDTVFNDTDTFYSIFGYSPLTGGSFLYGNELLTHAGDVIEYLISQSSMTFDMGRMAVVKPYLNNFKLSGCIVEQVSPYEFITANILPLLPVSMVNGPNGLYLIPWKYEATLKNVVDTFNFQNDPSLSLEQNIIYEGGSDVINDFTINYNLSQASGNMTKSQLLTDNYAVSTTSTGENVNSENIFCKESVIRYGRQSTSFESTIVRHSETAANILSWMSRAKCFATRVMVINCSIERGWLERGDVVSVTDSNLYLTDVIAFVEGIRYNDDATLSITLRLFNDVSQKFRY